MPTTIMTQPYAPVTAGGDPQPQHDRDTSNSDTLPPLPRRATVAHLASDDGDSGQADEALRRVRLGGGR